MQNLFAAVDVLGNMRFIDEVDRGLACDCFCPVCRAPVMAKQGQELEWHFAHVGGQERPECKAGAVNMLHRLAVELLRQRTTLNLPRYEQKVHARSVWRVHTGTASWDAQPRRVQWVDNPAKSAPVAMLSLDNGITVELVVEVAERPPTIYPASPAAAGRICFWCPLPPLLYLRSRRAATEHVQSQGRFLWMHQPDVFGLVAAELARLQNAAAAEDRHAEQQQAQHRIAAGRRWARIASRSHSGDQSPTDTSACAAQTREQPSAKRQAPRYDCAPGHKDFCSFVLYRLHDGSGWLVYELQDGGYAIAPCDGAEGWDEALPRSVGVADLQRGVYVAQDTTMAMVFFSARASMVRTSSNPADFAGL